MADGGVGIGVEAAVRHASPDLLPPPLPIVMQMMEFARESRSPFPSRSSDAQSGGPNTTISRHRVNAGVRSGVEQATDGWAGAQGQAAWRVAGPTMEPRRRAVTSVIKGR